MIWWKWDDDGKCWRPTLVPSQQPFRVNGRVRVIPVGRARRWALLAGDDARVNGLPCLPLEILEDRDEISVAGARYAFSVQSPPAVISFSCEGKRMRCARCLARLAAGDQIVLCPGCRAHHHAACWVYDARCQKCGLPTGGASWVPAPLN